MYPFENYDLLARLAPELALKFFVAVLCGGAIGMEREIGGKPAGLRTNIMICVGAMLFSVASVEIARAYGGDPGRLTAQIVSGIGFLGAGAILHESGRGVTGITTASLIWVMAAIGVLVGAGFLITSVGVSAATVAALLGLRQVEHRVDRRRQRIYTFTMADDVRTRGRLESLLAVYEDDVNVLSVNEEASGLSVKVCVNGLSIMRHEFLKEVYQIEGVHNMEWLKSVHLISTKQIVPVEEVNPNV